MAVSISCISCFLQQRFAMCYLAMLLSCGPGCIIEDPWIGQSF